MTDIPNIAAASYYYPDPIPGKTNVSETTGGGGGGG